MVEIKYYAFRLKQNQDLKKEIINFTTNKKLSAGFIVTCVGSLKSAKLRLANEEIKEFNQNFEIISLTGTLSQNGPHLHISLADNEGRVIGGHLKEGCLINTTAEVIIGDNENMKFSRKFDQKTNFKELIIS